MTNKTIGFFGDSFCSSCEEESWCSIVAKKLNSKIINLGMSGASIWTAIINFLDIVENNRLPNYSIFCWTDPYRLYHEKFIANHSVKITDENKNIVEASRLYKLYLSNQKKEHIEYEFVLKYFDKEILKPLENKTKIYQMWSIAPFELANEKKHIELQTGCFDNFSLYKFSEWKFIDYKIEEESKLINHMTAEKNKELANKVLKRLN